MSNEEKIFVVAREKSSWYIGAIANRNGKYVFKAQKQVKRLKDVKDTSSYVSLKKYVGKNKKLMKKLLEDTGLTSVYVMKRPSYCTEKEWNEYWWSKLNPKCLKCKEKCKQSSFADVLLCPEYKV